MRRGRGFTLLEVLVALAIFALSAAAVLRQTQLSAKQQYELELKSSALWMAENLLTELTTMDEWPPVGREEQEQNYQGQDWVIVADVQATPDPMLRKIQVEVALPERADGAAPLLSLVAYRGQY